MAGEYWNTLMTDRERSAFYAEDGRELGMVHLVEGSYAIRYRGETIAFRPDKETAMKALELYHQAVAADCRHERLNEDGICRGCGGDMRRGS